MSLPPLQAIANVVDFSALQADILGLLLSAPALEKIHVIEERKFLLASELEVSALWLTPRNGCQGAGLLVEMIGANVQSPNLSGPVLDLDIGIVAVEERNLNFTPGVGSFLTSEQLAQIVQDVLHRLHIAGYGTFQGRGISPARDWFDADTGISATRASFVMANPRSQTPRCGAVTMSLLAGEMTLTCPTATAEIYFTTDGSVPARTGNAASTRYEVPFTVASGQKIRAAAYATGFNISAVNQALIV